MSIKIHCPFCGQNYVLDDFNEGANAECAKCGECFELNLSVIGAGDDVKSVSAQYPAGAGAPEKASSQKSEAPDVSLLGTPERSTYNGCNGISAGKVEKQNFKADAPAPPAGNPSEGKSMSAQTNRPVNVFIKLFMVAIVGLLVVMVGQMIKMNDKLESMSHKLESMSYKSNPIIGFKIINYTWEYQYTMDAEFKEALDAGYEPVGYVCQNSIKGGFFLFVKRAR